MDHDTAILIRRHLDGELTPEEHQRAQALLAEDPEATAMAETDGALRDSVTRVMADVSAPAGLADQIRAAAREDQPVVGKIDPANPIRANAFAVAATLALVTGAVLLGIFGPQINRFPKGGGVQDETAAAVALHASEEHYNCAMDPEWREQKALWTDRNEASRMLGALLGSPVSIPDLSAFGFEFMGAGKCDAPVQSDSGHLFYGRDVPGMSKALLSVFVMPDPGGMVDAAGQWTEADGGPRCTHTILRASDGQLVYFVCCCDETDLIGMATMAVPLR